MTEMMMMIKTTTTAAIVTCHQLTENLQKNVFNENIISMKTLLNDTWTKLYSSICKQIINLFADTTIQLHKLTSQNSDVNSENS